MRGAVRGRGVCMVGFGACVAGVGACIAGGMQNRGHAWQGVFVARGHAWQGGMHGRGACMAGGHAWQGVCMVGHCSGRYTSYWNAFLLLAIITKYGFSINE